MVSYFAYVDHHKVTQVLPVVLEAAKTFHAARPIIAFAHQVFGLPAPDEVVEAHNIIHFSE